MTIPILLVLCGVTAKLRADVGALRRRPDTEKIRTAATAPSRPP